MKGIPLFNKSKKKKKKKPSNGIQKGWSSSRIKFFRVPLGLHFNSIHSSLHHLSLITKVSRQEINQPAPFKIKQILIVLGGS